MSYRHSCVQFCNVHICIHKQTDNYKYKTLENKCPFSNREGRICMTNPKPWKIYVSWTGQSVRGSFMSELRAIITLLHCTMWLSNCTFLGSHSLAICSFLELHVFFEMHSFFEMHPWTLKCILSWKCNFLEMCSFFKYTLIVYLQFYSSTFFLQKIRLQSEAFQILKIMLNLKD